MLYIHLELCYLQLIQFTVHTLYQKFIFTIQGVILVYEAFTVADMWRSMACVRVSESVIVDSVVRRRFSLRETLHEVI